MKKWILTAFLISQICLAAQADIGMPVSSQVNNSIFSSEATKPLSNLERTRYTNQGIMNIENKYNVHSEQKSTAQADNEVQEKEKGLKSWFKGFVCEW